MIDFKATGELEDDTAYKCFFCGGSIPSSFSSIYNYIDEDGNAHDVCTNCANIKETRRKWWRFWEKWE